MKTITITCSTCDKEFEKPRGEYNRRVRLGKKKLYCSLSCAGKDPEQHKHLLEIKDHYPVWELNNPSQHDELSLFRPIMKLVRQRQDKKEYDITLEYLKEIWDAQDGICPMTGFKLELRTYKGQPDLPLHIRSASLDRIDNSKGYLKGNVRFVSVMFNFARNKFSDDDVIEFAQAVIDYRG